MGESGFFEGSISASIPFFTKKSSSSEELKSEQEHFQLRGNNM